MRSYPLTPGRAASAKGQKLTLASELGMSALPLKADMLSVSIDVRFVPIADIGDCWQRQTPSAHMGSPRISLVKPGPSYLLAMFPGAATNRSRLRRTPPRLCVDLPLPAVL